MKDGSERRERITINRDWCGVRWVGWGDEGRAGLYVQPVQPSFKIIFLSHLVQIFDIFVNIIDKL